VGILNLAHLSTDGTKQKANASNNYSLSKEEIEELKQILEQGIAIDKEEDKLYGDKRGDELPSNEAVPQLPNNDRYPSCISQK